MTQKKTHLNWFWENLDLYLLRNKLKQTKQRQIIIEHFLQRNDHIDAEGLFERVRKKGHNIGLATIYRTLNLLKDAGLVEQSSFSDGRSVFEVLIPGNHHDHIICTACNKVVEFKNEAIEKIQIEIAKMHGFDLRSHRLDMFGICLNCQTKTE